MKKLKYIIILFSIIINNSCTEKINYTGKILNDDKLEYQNLKDKKELINLLGYPSYVDPIENKHYYFTEKNINKNFFNNKIESRKMLVFEFDNLKQIISMKEYNLDDQKDIKIVKDITPNDLLKTGLIEGIFGGVGRSNIPSEN